MVDLVFALLHLALILFLVVRKPISAVWAVLILSSTTGFFSRLAFYLGRGSPPLDFIRFAVELGALLLALKAFFARDTLHTAATRQIDRLFWICLAFFTLCALNVFFTGPKATIWGWRWTCLPMLMYIVGRSIGSHDRFVWRADRALIGLLLLLAAYGATQALVGLLPHEQYWVANIPEAERDVGSVEGGMFFAGHWRYPSLTTGHTFFAYISAFLFLWTLFSRYRSATFQIARLIVLGITLVAVLATGERAGLGMIAIGLIIALALKIRRQIGRLLVGAVGTLAVLGLLLVNQVDVAAIPKTNDNVTLIRAIELANPLRAETVRWRLQVVWPLAVRRIAANPLGYGLGSYQTTRDNQEQAARGVGYYFPPHSAYLQLALETGLLGLGIYLWLIVVYMRFLVRSYLRDRAPYAVRAIAALIAVLAIGLFNPVQPPLTLFLWFTIGLTTSCVARTVPVGAGRPAVVAGTAALSPALSVGRASAD